MKFSSKLWRLFASLGILGGCFVYSHWIGGQWWEWAIGFMLIFEGQILLYHTTSEGN